MGIFNYTSIEGSKAMELFEVSTPSQEVSGCPSAKPATKPATAQDVADRAGVARPTVSAILNGARTNSAVSPATRKRIEQAALELGYRANPVAQRLRKGRANDTIALYSPALDGGPTIAKMQHMQTLLNREGFDVQFHGRPYQATPNGAEGSLLSTLRYERPRAIIANAGWSFSEAEAHELRLYQQEGGLVVCLAYGAPVEVACDQAVFDESHSVTECVTHLMQLGHRAIGYVVQEADTPSSAKHNRYFEQAMRDVALTLRADWIVGVPGVYGAELGVKFKEHYSTLSDRPSAWVVGNEEAAAAFVHQLARDGVQVPRDMSLISVTDGPSAHCGLVQLSAVSSPYLQHTEQAVHMLMARLKGSMNEPRIETIRGNLIVRESTARWRP